LKEILDLSCKKGTWYDKRFQSTVANEFQNTEKGRCFGGPSCWYSAMKE
jgi:hypothetical protein